MKAVGKFIISITSLIFGIVIILIVLPSQLHEVQQTTNQTEQSTSQINEKILNTIAICDNASSIGDLKNCKETMTFVKNECGNSTFSSVSACNDPRIDQFLSTVDGIIASTQTQGSSTESKMNADILQGLDQCSHASDVNTISECQSLMLQIKKSCFTYPNMTACDDPRIPQMVNMGQTTTPSQQSTAPSSTAINVTVFNNLNNETENILNECVNTTISNSTTCIHAINTIKQDCNGTLKSYLSYLPTCHDPRLQ
ncbi:MAG: hypothetical protein WAN47_00995 [Nitrosotalea sp.]